MHKLEKPRNKGERFSNNINNPSFSSTLLDEIYRSIDVGNTKSPGHFNFYRDKTNKHTDISMSNSRTSRCNADHVNNNIVHQQRRRHDFVEFERKFLLLQQQRKHDPDFDPDLLFFSSSSNSSDSSSGCFSSSDTDSIRSTLLPPTMPKPVKTTASSSARSHKSESRGRPLFYDKDGGIREESDTTIKKKSRALKIYSKVKQPISPGGKVANFINSLFTAGTPKKKSKDPTPPHSSCSSARSCLSKNTPSMREKLRNGEKRTVRFYPVSEDSRPREQKEAVSVSDGDGGGEWDMMKQRVMEKSRSKVEEVAREFLKEYHRIEKKQVVNFEEQGMEDDVSCSSSDLFELDHNAVIEREDIIMFSDSEESELPVFETTRFHSNRNRLQ
ncbi:Protein BIG GRAIN 1-like B [Linum grandiflorum]